MWRIKLFKFRTMEEMVKAKQAFDAWLRKNANKVQWEQVYVENAYGVQWRPLRKA